VPAAGLVASIHRDLRFLAFIEQSERERSFHASDVFDCAGRCASFCSAAPRGNSSVAIWFAISARTSGVRCWYRSSSRDLWPVIHDSLVSDAAFDAIIASDYVFGCLDSEGARLVLTELCAAYAKPYVDMASDIIPGRRSSTAGRSASRGTATDA